MRRSSLALAFALALALPSALADWHGIGTREPDTSFDVASHRMFTAPDTSPSGMRVYFDAFATQGGPEPFSPLNGANVNPNVGLLGSRIQPAGLVQFNALLGIWKDCNHDGYVGLAEVGVQEYRSELLVQSGGTTTCPATGAFNDGRWVDEFLFIGMVDPCQFQNASYRADHCSGIQGVNQVPPYLQNPRVYNSNDTYVWGDWGAPGAVPTIACSLAPFPRGTTAGPGTLIAVADCQDGREISRVLAAAPVDTSGVISTRLPANLFGDPGSGRAGLVQRGSSDPAFTMWDCSQPQGTIGVGDSTGLVPSSTTLTDPTPDKELTGYQPIPVVGQVQFFPTTVQTKDARGNVVSLPSLAASVKDPTGSWWDAMSTTLDGVGPAGDCTAKTPGAFDNVYPGSLVESDRAILTPYKSSNDSVMTFSRGYRGESHLDPYLGTSDVPDDGGVVYTRNLYGGPLWMAAAPTLADPDLVDRSDLTIAGARTLSFYVRLNASDISAKGWTLPDPSTATYGSEWCGAHTSGTYNGWQCDLASWYRAADGSSTMPRYAEGRAIGQLPGAPYQLRDVDCYDGQLVHDVPVYAGGAALGASATCSP